MWYIEEDIGFLEGIATKMYELTVSKEFYTLSKKVVLILSAVCLGTIVIGGLIIVNNDPVSNWGNQIYEFSELLFKATDDKYIIGRNVIRMSDITFILLSFCRIVSYSLKKSKDMPKFSHIILIFAFRPP